MGKKKRKYWIDIPQARKFLYNAYGLKSKEQNWYELWIVHEEYKAVFHWYHTQGTLMMRYKKDDEQVSLPLGSFGDEESVAIRIVEEVQKNHSGSMYWSREDKDAEKRWKLGLEKLMVSIPKRGV